MKGSERFAAGMSFFIFGMAAFALVNSYHPIVIEHRTYLAIPLTFYGVAGTMLLWPEKT